ncbi:MAG TPA: ABC transporter ATP-binding protein [Streptosporangiaceae bacterium]|nr:ABC transporter ATP-binding protein [Streptosporangiaceae bacterium]
MEQTPLAALWRTREYLRPYYGRLAAMLAAAVAAAAAEIVIPLVIKAVVDGPIQHGNSGALLPLGLAATALGVTQAALSLYRRWVQARAVTDMERSMRDSLYAHLQRLHAGFHDEWQSGQLLSRATTDLSAIRRFAGFGTIFFVTNVVTFVAVIGLLIQLNWWLGLLTGCVFVPVLALCARFERGYRVLSRRVQDQEGDLATYVEEAATGIRVLKALGRRDEAAARHGGQAALVRATQIEKARLRGTFWASLDLVPNAVIGLILLLGALAVGRGELSLGGLVAFIALALQLVWPIEAMGYILATGQEAATAAQRIYEIFDVEPAIGDPLRQSGAPRSAAEAQIQQGRLRFDHVTFTYPGARAPVLRDVSLELEPGETVALVGPNGAGKTTLLHLVPRLADVSGGAILLDGTDIRDLPLSVLRTAVGCAFEDPTLFSASVRENVSYGAAGAAEDELLAALDAAQADFVEGLPWGLDTRIGEQGMALSGGQRQRVALARAILAGPAVLLLDDPLSALDVHTEARVTRALSRLLAASTALIVAHRPSTVALADRVALLDGGVIAATGSHQELLATQERYRELMSGGGEQELDQAADLTETRR